MSMLARKKDNAEPPCQVIELRPQGRLDLPDGSSAVLVGGALEIRDKEGMLRIRYSGDEAEVSAPRDLKLSAPRGRVVIDAATDVVTSAARDITYHAGRRLELCAAAAQRIELDPQRARIDASRLDVDAQETKLNTVAATVMARTLHSTAELLVTKAERYEIVATTLVTKAKDALHEVAELCESRIGRARTLVAGAFNLRSGRTVMVSKQETSIDGERILLG